MQAFADIPQARAGDLMLVQHAPEAFVLPHAARSAILQLHCQPNPQEVGRIRTALPAIDRLMFVSAWQAEQYRTAMPELPDEKILVSRNGVDLEPVAEATAGAGEHDPFAILLTAQRERGLNVLLGDEPPHILKREPRARLHLAAYQHPTPEELTAFAMGRAADGAYWSAGFASTRRRRFCRGDTLRHPRWASLCLEVIALACRGATGAGKPQECLTCWAQFTDRNRPAVIVPVDMLKPRFDRGFGAAMCGSRLPHADDAGPHRRRMGAGAGSGAGACYGRVPGGTRMTDGPRRLNDRQQRFADAVLGGMSLSRAYREAGYSAATEANGSRLIKTNHVAQYLAERRVAATERSEVTLAQVLRDLREIAIDKAATNCGPRVEACRLLIEHLSKIAPPVRSALPVPEVADEAEMVKRVLGIVDGMLAGLLTPAQALEMSQVVLNATQVAHGATLAAEILEDRLALEGRRALTAAAATQEPAVMPKWLKRSPGTAA